MRIIKGNNIYQNVTDALLYLVLYLILPTFQTIANFMTGDAGGLWSAMLLLAGILYDCYTRYGGLQRKGKGKIIAIGVSAAVMMLASLCMLGRLFFNGTAINPWFYLIYSLETVLWAICLNDLIRQCKRYCEI